MRWIGKAQSRLEDRRFVVGKGQYTDDIELPNQVWAAFLRSPHAHARIKNIDTSAASALPGVVAVLTGEDYLADGFVAIDHGPNPADAVEYTQKAFIDSETGSIYNRAQMPLSLGKVRHVGEAVAMVIAETPVQARDGVEAVIVDYEPLPAVVDANAALKPGAPQLYEDLPHNCCFSTEIGELNKTEAIFNTATLVVRRQFNNSRTVNAQMEPRAAIGQYDSAKDTYTLISGSQGVIRQQQCLASAFKVPLSRMRVICPDVGGGFGARTFLNMEPVCVLWAAQRIGRPVKWTGDRSEAFISDYQGRGMTFRAAMAFDTRGKILALDVELVGNVGAHTVSYVPMANAMRVASSVYDVPVISMRIKGVVTNTVPTGPYRGAGRPETVHVIERILDIAARELKIDRLDIRRKNIIPRESLPCISPMGLPYDSGNFLSNMERVIKISDWHGFKNRRKEAMRRGKLLGIGLANYIESPVGAPKERIEMCIEVDGTIDIISGTQSTGQGHETTFAQVVADHLGVPLNTVRLRTGDTKFVKGGGGTHSDRSMRIGGKLLVEACQLLLQKAQAAAAHSLRVDVQNLRRDGKGYFVESWGGLRKRRISLAQIAQYVQRNGMPEEPDDKALKVIVEFNGRIPAFPTGAAVCEAEVDPDTGSVEIIKYCAVDDVGQVINPLIVEGQIHGGLAQGLGQALTEDFMIDPESGQIFSGSFMDYGMPSISLMPPLQVEFANDLTKGNPLGVKGGGESGITPATACVFNALSDALANYTNDELPMPATPSSIWSVINSCKQQIGTQCSHERYRE